MKIILTTLLIIISSVAYGKKGVDFTHSLDKAVQKALEEDKYIFVDFTAKWCRPCKNMNKTVFRNDEVAKLYNKHFINVKLDERKNRKLLNKFNITGYPTLIYMDKYQNIVYHIDGGLDKDGFIQIGEMVLKNIKVYNTRLEKLASYNSESTIRAYLSRKSKSLKKDFVLLIQHGLFLSDLHRDIILSEYANLIKPEILTAILEEKDNNFLNNNKFRDIIALNFLIHTNNMSLKSISEVHKKMVSYGYKDSQQLKSYLAAFYVFELNKWETPSVRIEQQKIYAKRLLLNYPECPDLQFLLNTLFHVVNQINDKSFYIELEKTIAPLTLESDYFLIHDIYAVCLKKNGNISQLLTTLDKINTLTKSQNFQFTPTVLDLKDRF